MNFIVLVGNINWLAVIVVTILSFLLGMLWHTPFLFGKTWANENNPTGDKQKINAPLMFGGTAVLHFIAFAGLSIFVSGRGAAFGFIVGLAISIFWVLPAVGGTYLFANRKLRLLAIDVGFYTVLFSVAWLTLGVW